MGYLNPMMQYGIERLFARCREAGIDALIIPDLPFGEYMRDFRDLCRKYDLPMIMLITPETSNERIRLIDDNCDGFIYMVSAAATTGTRESFGPSQLDYFRRIAALGLSHPRRSRQTTKYDREDLRPLNCRANLTYNLTVINFCPWHCRTTMMSRAHRRFALLAKKCYICRKETTTANAIRTRT